MQRERGPGVAPKRPHDCSWRYSLAAVCRNREFAGKAPHRRGALGALEHADRELPRNRAFEAEMPGLRANRAFALCILDLLEGFRRVGPKE